MRCFFAFFRVFCLSSAAASASAVAFQLLVLANPPEATTLLEKCERSDGVVHRLPPWECAGGGACPQVSGGAASSDGGSPRCQGQGQGPFGRFYDRRGLLSQGRAVDRPRHPRHPSRLGRRGTSLHAHGQGSARTRFRPGLVAPRCTKKYLTTTTHTSSLN